MRARDCTRAHANLETAMQSGMHPRVEEILNGKSRENQVRAYPVQVRSSTGSKVLWGNLSGCGKRRRGDRMRMWSPSLPPHRVDAAAGPRLGFLQSGWPTQAVLWLEWGSFASAQSLPPTQTSAEDQPVGLAQQMRGFAVVAVEVAAVRPLRTKHKHPTIHHLAHRHNEPGFFRNNVDRDEVNLGRKVRSFPPALAATNVHRIQALSQMGDGLYLHPVDVLPSLHNEVKRMHRAVRLGHHEPQLRRLVQKSTLPKIAVSASCQPALPVHFPDRDILRRWSASDAPVFAHE